MAIHNASMSRFAKAWAAIRGKDTPAPSGQRHFAGAQLNRLTYGWVTQPLSLDEELRTQYSLLLARAREQYINNPWVRGYVQMVLDNVIGQGVRFQARTQNLESGTPDQAANEALEEWYLQAGKLGQCDMSGTMTRLEMDQLFMRRMAIDGEVLLRKHAGVGVPNQWNFAVSFVDPRRLDISLNKDLRDGVAIRMGVEIDQHHRPLAYYLLPLRGDGTPNRDFRHDRVPAELIYHKFIREDVRQTRGTPALAIALLRLNMLGGYEEAELVAARAAAAKMGFFEQDPNVGGAQYHGDGKDTSGSVITDAEAGTFEMLPMGVKYQAHDPTHPNDAFGDFVKYVLRGIATGLGVSYNKLANDLEGVNFSSLREGNLFERETWKAWQDWFISQWKEPHYCDSLELALLSRQITIMGNPLDVGRIDKYKRVEFMGRRWPWVDPLKEGQANQLALDDMLKSRTQIIRESTNRDPAEVWQEIATENELMKQLGVAPLVRPMGAPPNAEDEEEEQDGSDGAPVSNAGN